MVEGWRICDFKEFLNKTQHPEIVITFHDTMLYDLNRYEDAISKYETVMKTEPEVPVYSTRAKERICHCLSKVILLISLCKCLQDKHETELPQLHEFGFTFASLESAGYRSHQTLYRSSAAGTNQCECPERQSRSLFARRHV